MNEWYCCESCDSEFKVVTIVDNPDRILFCPFCSEDIELEDDEEEEDTYWDDE
jgi:hypothetical protein